MQVAFNKESEIIEKNLTFLATAGSTAPFIGLFGTVWGIMNSFQSIAIAQNTNLISCSTWYSRGTFCYCFRFICGNTCCCCI